MEGSDFGLRLGDVLRVVARLHSDTSRLLIDCDKHIGKGRTSLFGSYATRDLTYSVKADAWMPEGVYRYYDAGPSTVDGVTVAFYSLAAPGLLPQPIVIAGRIEYTPANGDAGGKVQCDAWDLWHLFFRSGDDSELGTVLGGTDLLNGRIARASWIAAPLISISSVDSVVKLMDKVRVQNPT